jgi:tetratricopeptide (TPR) repeat protein
MRIRSLLFLVAVALSWSSALSAQPANVDADAEIAHAIALIDSGKLDEAIAKLKSVIAADPTNELARYELGLAYAAKGDSAQCRVLFEPLAAEAGEHQTASLAMLGNCLDQLGERDKAIDAYRRGLKNAPDDASLLFNLAVTVTQKGELDEVRKLMQNNTRKNPWHASGHLLLARVFHAQGFRVPAALAYLHFLALESSTPRAAEAAQLMQGVVRAGVTATNKGANITIDPNARTEEGDFKSMELMLALVSASEGLEKNKKRSDFEKALGSITSMLAIYLESEKTGADYTSTVQRPFFSTMSSENLVAPFAALALSTLGLKGTDGWMKKNAAEVERYRKWIAPQTKKPAVTLPH